MSMTVFELLEKLNQNPIGKEFLETAKKPDSQEEYAAALADISARCGIEISQIEILDMLKTTEEERIRQFEATKDDIEALDDDELDGGPAEFIIIAQYLDLITM